MKEEEYNYITGTVHEYYEKIEGSNDLDYWLRGSLFLSSDEEPEYEDIYPIINTRKCHKNNVD